ncbi:DUF3549 family protein [Halomonas urumqiensis]|uniref:DUF3549 domain-containing protein n=1 Tax=Halomonas urumqiensis TaxID=1684789 RepID=A0A2N7UKU8_9GAMM|nr:DUF3549 family protein [Halomonas urumqiensis]PMR81054.1 DUF3549 domain-containing protein [Halomonas urumqiensis]PTB01089.1 DUF3549 domain-containing protein [Halomonas urumqiensis]GHE22814.1 hypothetical protein GCM10017767_33350 [Halomonas urumqiensis]
MQPIHSLHDFFERSGAEVWLYHLGRRVEPCSMATLAAFEAGEQPWPLPWQGQARLGLVFRLAGVDDPLIWFLALPLDEQGLLVPAPRDAFVQRLLETLGRSATALDQGDGLSTNGLPVDGKAGVDNLMQDNPLAFSPSLPFQALLHARASRDLDQPASQHLEPVEAYLSGQQDFDWQALGLQGLADFSVRMDANAALSLAKHMPTLPSQVVISLCYCLEHLEVDDNLALALRERGEKAAQSGDIEAFCACVRAVSGANDAVAGAWIDALLADPDACGPDLLAAIAARGYRHLEHAQRLPRFLERLASCDNADFMGVARDLALIPRLRLLVLMTLRDVSADTAIGRRLATLTRLAGTATR